MDIALLTVVGIVAVALLFDYTHIKANVSKWTVQAVM
jgi:hypothetical protein